MCLILSMWDTEHETGSRFLGATLEREAVEATALSSSVVWRNHSFHLMRDQSPAVTSAQSCGPYIMLLIEHVPSLRGLEGCISVLHVRRCRECWEIPIPHHQCWENELKSVCLFWARTGAVHPYWFNRHTVAVDFSLQCFFFYLFFYSQCIGLHWLNSGNKTNTVRVGKRSPDKNVCVFNS